MKHKIWLRLALRIGVIFAVFVGVLAVSNQALLANYYIWREKNTLKETGAQIQKLDLGNVDDTLKTLTDILNDRDFYIDIYDKDGNILYTTFGQQVWDIYGFHRFFPSLNKRRELQTLDIEPQKDGSRFETVLDPSINTQYIIYHAAAAGGSIMEIRIQKDLLEKSADIANRFILMISCLCLAGALIWVIVFAKTFSRPIVQMNEITRDMADLKFERKLKPASEDEIGQLAVSINELSNRLDTTLTSLRESNAQLRSEIEMERQLDVMRRGFVSNVSHELKTPISIIRGYAEGLKLNISDDPEKRDQYCDIILEESIRMNHLVLDLLELSRYESGQVSIRKEIFDAAKVARSMAHKFRQRFEEKGVRLADSLPGSLPAFGDPARIEQVLQNYLSNAASHVSEKGTVTLASRDLGGLVRIDIINTGETISEENMPQIWQSFYRADPSHKREEGRFGLGLSIVRAIMELHGRECGVYNTGDGVGFWFTLDKPDQTAP